MEPSRTGAASGCFAEDEILELIGGRATEQGLGEFEAHLNGCPRCRLVLAGALDDRSVTNAAEEAPRPLGPTMFSAGAMVGRRYRVLSFIARGGMGEVYEVEDTLLNERIALKTVLSNIADDSRAVARLKYEVQTARRVTNGNVCRIFDVGIHEFTDQNPSFPPSVAFITMELLTGETLAARIARIGRFEFQDALPVLEHLASGLDAAHEVGVIHRDFKSDNIMLVDMGAGRCRAVIMDFGLARTLIASRSASASLGSRAMLGTVGYMAPEQVEGAAVSAAADIYAFGIVAYEMLTGTLPFKGSTPLATAVKRLRTPPPPLSTYVPDIDARCQTVVLKCLASDPKDRFATAREAVMGLREILQNATGAGGPAARRRRVWLVGAIGMATVVGLAVWRQRADVPRPSIEDVRAPAVERPSTPASGSASPKGGPEQAPAIAVTESVATPPSAVSRSKRKRIAAPTNRAAAADVPGAPPDSKGPDARSRITHTPDDEIIDPFTSR